jgi:branched-chain amino acid aminotransferase
MSFDQTKWTWSNGRLIPWADATTHVSAHALHYGSGVFEGLRCYETPDGPAVFRLYDHIERFFNSAAVYGLEIPYNAEELASAVCDVIQRNEFTSCYVRPLCYFGSSSLGLHPAKCPVEVVILAWPWGAYLGAEGMKTGIRITVSPWRKFHSQMMPTTSKGCGQYLNSILAVRDAVNRGFDEALLLDIEGNIAEGPGENLFIVHHGELFTNDVQHSILLGITRDSVIRIARDLGYAVTTRTLSVDDLISADEAFFTGTAAEVTPIREVDGMSIGDGKRGKITEKIQDAFFSITAGRSETFRDWLHLVAPQPVCR